MGEPYPTVEHAYQAAKTTDPFEREKIRLAATPGQAKRLGLAATMRSDWERVKIDIMRELLWQKFSGDPVLRMKLLDTGDAAPYRTKLLARRRLGYLCLRTLSDWSEQPRETADGDSEELVIKIGTATLLHEHTFHDASFETAAWWQDVKCAPQTVPCYSKPDFDMRGQIDKFVHWSFEGVVTDAYFPALWCGVPIGSGDPTGGKVGQQANYRFMRYDYTFAEAVLNGGQFGEHVKVTLDQPWVVATTQFYHALGAVEKPELKGHHSIVDRASWELGNRTIDDEIARIKDLADYYADQARRLGYPMTHEKPETREYSSRTWAYEDCLAVLYRLRGITYSSGAGRLLEMAESLRAREGADRP